MNPSSIKPVALAFALLLTPILRADVVLGGAVFFYSPPIPMFGGDEAGDAGLPIEGTEYRTEGGTNGYAQVNFQLMSIVAIFPRPSQPPAEIRSIADLKGYLDTSMKGRTNLLNVSTGTGKFSGREAVTCKAQMLSGPSKRQSSLLTLLLDAINGLCQPPGRCRANYAFSNLERSIT